MPWKEVTQMSEKKRFIDLFLTRKHTVSELSKTFGISRPTAYKYIDQFTKEGYAGLNSRNRRPHTSPHKTQPDIEELILSLRNIHPGWGGEKLRRLLMIDGITPLPSEKTIDRILKRHGLITEEESQKHKAWTRFEHENPNDLWQMDFKGHFAIAEQRCYPLTLLDDHSRFCIGVTACKDQRSDTVKAVLTEIFKKYGLPKRMTMDNGSPWGYSGNQLHTHLTAWLIHLGIYVSHSRPLHPQTQGKLERMHRTLNLELLKRFSFRSLEESQQGFDWWRKIYNEVRPHDALKLEVPASRYRRSERIYPETLPRIEYSSDFEVRKVQHGGYIHYKGKVFKIGDAFHGQAVGLKQGDDGLIEVFFCHQRVNKLDPTHPYEG